MTKYFLAKLPGATIWGTVIFILVTDVASFFMTAGDILFLILESRLPAWLNNFSTAAEDTGPPRSSRHSNSVIMLISYTSTALKWISTIFMAMTKTSISIHRYIHRYPYPRQAYWYLFALLQETHRIYNITHKLSQLLHTDLQYLAHGMVKNRFINMTHFSETTHLNTVLISGLLCHISVFLLYAKDITFLDPITLIHYKPTSLLDRYLPAISTSVKPSPVSLSCILLISLTHTPVTVPWYWLFLFAGDF